MFLIHSINNYRNFSKKSYDSIKLNYDSSKSKTIDNYSSAIKYSNQTVIIDNENSEIHKKIKSDKILNKIYKQANHTEILLSSNASTTDWLNVINSIDSILHEL